MVTFFLQLILKQYSIFDNVIEPYITFTTSKTKRI